MLADKHAKEDERLDELYSLAILDTGPEADFDDIVSLAAEICGTPIALISFVDKDRQWFKARRGLTAQETGLDKSVCAHALLQTEILEVPDTLQDARTVDNPLIQDPEVEMRFYAGAPIMGSSDLPLGTLCVLDKKPRQLSESQKRALEILARRVTKELNLRAALKQTETLNRANANKAEKLQRMLELSETLKLEIDHRVKNSLQQVSSFIRLQASRSENPEVREALAEAAGRVTAVASVHSELGRARATDRVDLAHYLPHLLQELQVGAPANVKLEVVTQPLVVGTSVASALGIIINEFVANAIKHAFPENRQGQVLVRMEIARDGGLCITLSDDGVGRDADAMSGNGLGTRLIDAMCQQIGAEAKGRDGAEGTVLVVKLPPQAVKEAGPSVEAAAAAV